MFKHLVKNSNKKIVYIIIGTIAALITIPLSFAFLPLKPFTLKMTQLKIKNAPTAIYFTYYKDLNNDGKSEKIIFNRITQYKPDPNIKVFESSKKLILEKHLSEQWIFDAWRTGDFDHDSLKEIYVFTRKRYSTIHDSVFLYAIDPFKRGKNFLNRVFILTSDEVKNNPNLPWNIDIKILGLWDLDGDGYGDLVYSINSNEGWVPRNLFAFSIKKKKLIAKSPYLGNLVDFAPPVDFDNDGQLEFYSMHSRIVRYNYPKYLNSFLSNNLCFFALDKNLQFKIKPIKFPSSFKMLYFKYIDGSSPPRFFLIGYDGSATEFAILDLSGKILKSTSVQSWAAPILGKDESTTFISFPLFFRTENSILNVTPDLKMKIVYKKKEPSFGRFFRVNINSDPKLEILRFKIEKSKDHILTVFKPDFSHPTDVKIPGRRVFHSFFSVKSTNGAKSQFCISKEYIDMEFSYGPNPIAFLNFAFIALGFVLVFLILYLFFLLINTLLFYYHFLARHLNTINKGALLLSFQGKVLHYNQNFLAMLNIPTKIKPGVSYSVLFRSHLQILNFIERLMNGKTKLSEELTFQKGDSTFKGRLYGYFLTGIAGIHSGYCVEVYDMSESILTEREEVISRLIRKMAHDIKTPLSTIKFSIETMRYVLPKSEFEKVGEDIDTMAQEINHINAITENYSKFARLSRLNLQVVSLKEIIQKVVGMYELPNTIKVSIDVLDYADVITADGKQIEVLIKEIFENALDAIVDRGEIKFKVHLANFSNETHTDAVCLRINDNGHGIAKKIKDQIFEPSFSTKDQGTGFGLALVQRIVQNHGGQIIIDSEKGKGTQVQIILPRDAIEKN